jgi:hypothetical protein
LLEAASATHEEPVTKREGQVTSYKVTVIKGIRGYEPEKGSGEVVAAVV